MYKNCKFLLCTIIFSIIIAFSCALTVKADPLEPGIYNFICVDGGRYLNVYAGQDSNGARVCVWERDGSKEQNFNLVNTGWDNYMLYPQSSSTGRVLDVNRGNSYYNPIRNGNIIDIWIPNDKPAQLWLIDNRGDGKYTIELSSLRGSVLTVSNPGMNNGGVSLQAYTGSNNQLWYLQKVGNSSTSYQSSQNYLESSIGKRLANFSSAAYNANSPLKNYKGQCTWYAWGRALEKTGIRLNTVNNAKTWLNRLNTSGTKAVWDPYQPRANSVAVSTAGTYGHVMFVEDVIGDTVYYTEANVPVNNVIDYNDGILKSTSKASFARKCNGYIYLN